MKQIVLSVILIAVFSLLFCVVPVTAHSGGTDSNGGHYNHSSGEYHWHHGKSAHQHEDRDGDGLYEYCPYEYRWVDSVVFLGVVVLVIYIIRKNTSR